MFLIPGLPGPVGLPGQPGTPGVSLPSDIRGRPGDAGVPGTDGSSGVVVWKLCHGGTGTIQYLTALSERLTLQLSPHRKKCWG